MLRKSTGKDLSRDADPTQEVDLTDLRSSRTPADPSCSFCGKNTKQVAKLIAGPGVYICDECIDVCAGIIDDYDTDDTDSAPVTSEAVEEITRIRPSYAPSGDIASWEKVLASYNLPDLNLGNYSYPEDDLRVSEVLAHMPRFLADIVVEHTATHRDDFTKVFIGIVGGSAKQSLASTAIDQPADSDAWQQDFARNRRESQDHRSRTLDLTLDRATDLAYSLMMRSATLQVIPPQERKRFLWGFVEFLSLTAPGSDILRHLDRLIGRRGDQSPEGRAAQRALLIRYLHELQLQNEGALCSIFIADDPNLVDIEVLDLIWIIKQGLVNWTRDGACRLYQLTDTGVNCARFFGGDFVAMEHRREELSRQMIVIQNQKINAGQVNFSEAVNNIASSIGMIQAQGQTQLAEAFKGLEQAVLADNDISDASRADLLDNVADLAEAAELPRETRKRGRVAAAAKAISDAASVAGKLGEEWLKWKGIIDQL